MQHCTALRQDWNHLCKFLPNVVDVWIYKSKCINQFFMHVGKPFSKSKILEDLTTPSKVRRCQRGNLVNATRQHKFHILMCIRILIVNSVREAKM